MSNDITWYEKFEDKLGIKLMDRKAARWFETLNAKKEYDGLEAATTNSELCAMIGFLAAKENFKVPDHFTVDHLFKWLCWYRKDQRQKRDGFREEDTGSEANVSRIKAAMNLAVNHEDRFEIMCTRSKTTDEINKVNSWALMRWPDWMEATNDVRAVMIRSAQIVRGIASDGFIKTNERRDND